MNMLPTVQILQILFSLHSWYSNQNNIELATSIVHSDVLAHQCRQLNALFLVLESALISSQEIEVTPIQRWSELYRLSDVLLNYTMYKISGNGEAVYFIDLKQMLFAYLSVCTRLYFRKFLKYKQLGNIFSSAFDK